MWRSIEDPPGTNRDVVVSDGEGGYAIAFYDKWGKTWHFSDSIIDGFLGAQLCDKYIKEWCEIPKLNE